MNPGFSRGPTGGDPPWWFLIVLPPALLFVVTALAYGVAGVVNAIVWLSGG